MLGKSSVVDPNARIAMILPGEDPELIEVFGEQQQEEEQALESEADSKDKKPQVKMEKVKGKNEKQISAQEKPAQPVTKKKEDKKPQPKTQQPKSEQLKVQSTTIAKAKPQTAAVEQAVPVKKEIEQPLAQQTEKPAGARYSIQVEAFGVQRNADKFLAKIKQKYPSAHIFENKEKKRLPLAVRVGYFKSYRKALEEAKIFEAREKRSAMVVKIGQ